MKRAHLILPESLMVLKGLLLGGLLVNPVFHLELLHLSPVTLVEILALEGPEPGDALSAVVVHLFLINYKMNLIATVDKCLESV